MNKRFYLNLLLLILVCILFSCTNPDGTHDGNQNVNDGKTDFDESLHKHNFAENLTYDIEYHYNSCSCGEKSNIAKHRMGDKKTVKEATEIEPGLSMSCCADCPWIEYQTIPQIAHSHLKNNEYQYDANSHWQMCTCGEKLACVEHSFEEWITKNEATETVDGLRERSCGICQYKESEYIPKIPHNHSYIGDYSKNNSGHWKVCVCGAVLERETHTFGGYTVEKEATETNTGLKKRVCSSCEYVESVIIPVLSHNHVFTAEYTYDEIGHYKVCSCGEKDSFAVHEFGEYSITLMPTCESKGEKTHICLVCGYLDSMEIPLADHTEIVLDYIAPSCTASGLTEGKKCSICNIILVSQQMLAPIGHSEVVGEAVEPTCYSFGYSAEKYCSVCNTVLVPNVKIAKIPHTYAEGTCSVCDFPEPSSGLSFTLSDDESYYILTGIGTCKDEIVVIPEEYNSLPVKEIAENAFQLCVSIHEIVIPNTVTKICDYAFSGCASLTNIIIGENINEIGFGVLYDTEYYRNISNWENGVLYLDNALIEVKSEGISEVEVKEGTTIIANYAFCRSRDLVFVTIPESVNFIGKYAFMWCSSLNSITLSRSELYAVSAKDEVLVTVNNSESALEVFTKTYYYCRWYFKQ